MPLCQFLSHGIMPELTFTELRETLALSVEDTAEILGVSIKTVYRWESGEITPKKAYFYILESMIAQRKSKRRQRSDFTFIDLFLSLIHISEPTRPY